MLENLLFIEEDDNWVLVISHMLSELLFGLDCEDMRFAILLSQSYLQIQLFQRWLSPCLCNIIKCSKGRVVSLRTKSYFSEGAFSNSDATLSDLEPAMTLFRLDENPKEAHCEYMPLFIWLPIGLNSTCLICL